MNIKISSSSVAIIEDWLNEDDDDNKMPKWRRSSKMFNARNSIFRARNSIVNNGESFANLNSGLNQDTSRSLVNFNQNRRATLTSSSMGNTLQVNNNKNVLSTSEETLDLEKLQPTQEENNKDNNKTLLKPKTRGVSPRYNQSELGNDSNKLKHSYLKRKPNGLIDQSLKFKLPSSTSSNDLQEKKLNEINIIVEAAQ